MGDSEPLTNGTTAVTNENGGNEWDHSWTCEEIRKHAEHWSLAADVGLLKHLQDFAERLTSKAQETSRHLSQLSYETNLTDASIQSVTDHFLTLSDSQFIENRVYDEDDSVANKSEEKEESKPKTKEERDAELLPKLSEAVRFGLSVLEDSYDVLDIKAGDSDVDSDDEDDDELNPNEVLLEPRDPYVIRPLPHLIGSRGFHQEDDVGVGDLPSSDEAESVGSLSESEDEVEKPPTVSDASSSEYDSDDLSDDGSVEDVPIKRTRSFNSSSDYTSSDNEDMFAKKHSSSESEEEPIVVQPKAKARTDSQLSKKKKKTQKKKKQEPEPDMFGDDDEDDVDDLFAPSSGLFRGKGKSLFGAPKDGGLFEGVEGSFDDEESESQSDDEKDVKEEEVEVKKPQQKKKNEKKPPTGGISLFGGAIKKGFFNGEETSDQSDASEEDEPPPQTSKPSKGLFDESGSDEDLFADAEPPRKDSAKSSPQVKTKSSGKSSNKKESTEAKTSKEKEVAPKSGGLFDQSEEEEEEVLFQETKPKEPEEPKTKKPVGGISMFGAGGNLLQDALNKSANKRKDSVSSFGSDTSKQSGRKSKAASFKSNTSKKHSLFSGSDSDDGGLFGQTKKTPVTMVTNKTPGSKSGSLFGESDTSSDGEQDLFSKPKPAAKKLTSNKEANKLGSNTSLASQKSKSSISKQKPSKFSDDDDIDLFGSKPKKIETQKVAAKKNQESGSKIFSNSNKSKQSEKSAIISKLSDSSDEGGLFSSKPPPLPSDSSSDSSIDFGPPKVTSGRGRGLFGDSESEEDDLFAGMSKAKPQPKPAKADKTPAKKKETKPEPKKTTPAPKKSSLFDGDESEDDQDGDLFSSAPAKKQEPKSEAKKEEPLKSEATDSGKQKQDSLFNEEPKGKSSLFESDSDVEIKVDGPPDDVKEEEEEVIPKKKLPGAVSMFGAGGGDLLAAIQKKRSASQRSNRRSESETKEKEIQKETPKDDKKSLFGNTESDEETPKNPEPVITPKPKVEEDKKVVGNTTARPFRPSQLSGRKSEVAKVVPPGKNSVGKLKTNLMINPTALLPGSTPNIKSSVDVDAPLESVTKTRSRGQAGRRPPSRQARRKVAEEASRDLQSNLFEIVGESSTPINSSVAEPKPDKIVKRSKPKPAKDAAKNVEETKRNDNNDDFLDSLLSSTSGKPTKPKQKDEKPKITKTTTDLPSIFDDADDLFSASPSTKKKPKPKKEKDLFDNNDKLADDLFEIPSKSKTKKPPKKEKLDEDLFSDVMDSGSSDLFNSSKKQKPKHGLFTDDLFADDFDVDKKATKKKAPLAKSAPDNDFDDLFADASPQVNTKKTKKVKSEKKALDLFGDDGDIFGDLPTAKSKPTKEKKKNIEEMFGDDEDIFSSEVSSKKSTKKKPKPNDDIFDDPLSAFS